MEDFSSLFMIVLGIGLRLGIPLLITIVIVVFLKRLDHHWQAEAKHLAVPTAESAVENPGCWDIKGCSAAMMKECAAYAQPDIPCWQVFKVGEGKIQEKCLDCEVFTHTPEPARSSI